MGSTRIPRMGRRLTLSVLAILLMSTSSLTADDSNEAWAALVKGGLVAVIRHGNAPPGYGGDPPGFRFDDCKTQRNLDDVGREQARALGDAFRKHGVRVGRIVASPVCRCMETGQLMGVGLVETSWALLPDMGSSAVRVLELEEMVSSWRGPGTLVLVTHGLAVGRLTGVTLEQAETLVLQPTAEKPPVGHLPRGGEFGGQDRATEIAVRRRLMMDRRVFLSTLGGGLLAAPLAAEGQQRRVPRVGLLLPGSPSDSTLFQNPDAFPNKLRELGWVDGGNVILEFRWTPDPDGYPTAVAELLRLGVNVLVTVGFEATSAAMKTTSTIPIVMTAFSDPRDVGAASLAHPGGNVTGMTTGQVEAELAKRLGLLKEALPAVRRVAILWDAKVVGGTTDLLAAASSLKVHLQNLDVTSVADYDAAFRTAQQGSAGAILAVEGARMLVNRILVAQLGLKHRLPLMSQYRQLVEANALLMSYGADLKDSGAYTASYVDRILKGAKPADLPIQQPTKYELIINLKTAKALGLTIPPSLLQRADHVIE